MGKWRDLPSAEVLRDLLIYDAATGSLIWRYRENVRPTWNTKHAGKPAFDSVSCEGYKIGRIFNIRYLAHRVIWKLVTGCDPKIIDHVNGIRSDNRWTNLRETDALGNARNGAIPRTNTSGHIGVCFNKSHARWAAYISHRYIGSFRTIDEAIAARKQAEVRLGYHPNHGTRGATYRHSGEAA